MVIALRSGQQELESTIILTPHADNVANTTDLHKAT